MIVGHGKKKVSVLNLIAVRDAVDTYLPCAQNTSLGHTSLNIMLLLYCNKQSPPGLKSTEENPVSL